MAFFGKKGPYDIDSRALDRTSSGKGRKTPSPQSRRMMLLLIFNTVLSVLIYFGAISVGFAPILFIYVGLAAVLLLVYVIYNRGFVLKDATPDMLSDEWTPEQKQAMLADAKRRREASRFMPVFIVPLVIAVMLDVIQLLLLEDLLLSLGVNLG